MEVNKLESRDVLVVLFGLPIMTAVIVLASIGVGHVVTTRSDRPANVVVSAATPKIEVNVPQQAAPKIEVAAAAPRIDVHPAQPAINVTPPPAVVTVLNRGAKENSEPSLALTNASPATPPKPMAVPAVAEKTAANTPETDKPAEAPQAPKPEAPAPAVKPEPKASGNAASESTQISSAVRDEELTLDTLYLYAEKYIESYCTKNNLDVAGEARRWNTKWSEGLEQAIRDNTDTDEQTYINRMVITKRECFDIEKATPEKIVEGCRIMLRYRDGQLAWLKVMKDAVTSDNLKKTLVFLSAGVR